MFYLSFTHRPNFFRIGSVQVVLVRKSTDLLSQFTGCLWIVVDLIVEDGEVKCQAQADGMCGLQFCHADSHRFLVCFL